MRIEKYNTEIKDLLQPLADLGVEVELLSEIQGEYDRPTPNKGRISVLFFEAKPRGDVKSAGRIVQDMDLTFHLMIQASKITGAFGISDLHNRARKLLIGKDLTDCDNMTSGGLMFSRYLGSVWEYAMVLNTWTRVVEDYEEYTNPATVQSVSFNEYVQDPQQPIPTP